MGFTMPEGTEELNHKCLNKGCVNPDHLEPLSRNEHKRFHLDLNRQPQSLYSGSSETGEVRQPEHEHARLSVD
jgi:hypothetical protein